LKVILTRDYEKLGNTGDIINVKDGFANNFLIPNNIAILATSGNIKQMELVKKSLIKKEAKNIEEAQKIAEVVDGIELKFKVNSSPDGKLYGSITNKDIAEMILEDKKIEIDRKKIELEEHIKEVGNYEIEVKLYKEVKAIIKVEVVSEDIVKEDGEEEQTEAEKTEVIDKSREEMTPLEETESKETAAAEEKSKAEKEPEDKFAADSKKE
jgi:large subunit ribosomal protein L9